MARTKLRRINRNKPKQKYYKLALFFVVVIFIVLGTWIGSVAYSNINKITGGGSGNSILDIFTKTELKGESTGRTNILLLGYGGVGHSGNGLSDTMEVLSIDWKTNQMATLSVPRDLWVNVPGRGFSKINAANAYGGAPLASSTVSQILGIPIHYTVGLDFNGFSQIVDSVGGLDINVEHSFTDYQYPKGECIDATGVNCGLMTVHFDAGLQHMDGTKALIYVRSRHSIDNGEGTDFARSRRQQLAMTALKTKLLNLNTLANPVKVTELLNSVGNHLATTLSLGEISSLWSEVKSIDSSTVITRVIDTSPAGPLTSTRSLDGQDILVPKRGIGVYTDLQLMAQTIFSGSATDFSKVAIVNNYPTPLVSPTPQAKSTITTTTTVITVSLANASGKTSVATSTISQLKKNGIQVTNTGAIAVSPSTIIYNCAGLSANSMVQKIINTIGGASATKSSCGGASIQIVLGKK